jgi:tetratricopeptide (TPR) repeat protein
LLNGQNVSYEAKSIPTMYDQEIYLNVQREFSGDVLLSAGYVHTKGTHLGFERDINQVPEALLGPGNAQSQRPYPQFQSISGLLWDARSNYDALQLRAEKRLSHGLYFVANYTWSKILDTATTSGASGNLSGQDVYQRSYDTKANYGLSVQAHLAQAQLDLSANSPAQAINQFKAVLAIDKNNATALANLGALTYLQGDCAGAVPYFQHALKLEPTFSKTKGLLAICETMMGDPSAQSLLEASFSELKDDRLRSQVGIQLVNLYYETGDFEHASTTIGALLQLNPDDTDVLYMAQRVYLEMADGTLNKLAIVAPKSARMQQVIAEHLINAGNVASAIEHYRAALKVNPRLPGVHFEIGECIMQLSTADTALAEAQKEFELALQYDGESARVEVRLGMIAAMSSRSDEAYEHYKRACDLNPHDVDAQMGLATALIHRDKPKDALPYLRNVVDADPMNTEARYRLAVVCKKLGLTEESAKQMTLFRQSKLLKNEVEGVFEQMNRPERKRPDEIVDKGK